MATTTREMDIRARAMLCDSAVVAEGKLYLQGAGWNQLNTGQYPFAVPRIGLGVLIDVAWTQTNRQHHLRIELVDEDGQPHTIEAPDGSSAGAVRAEAAFTLGRPPNVVPGDPQVVPFALNFDGLIFTKPGAYNLVISVDDEEYERLTFRAHPAVPSHLRIG